MQLRHDDDFELNTSCHVMSNNKQKNSHQIHCRPVAKQSAQFSPISLTHEKQKIQKCCLKCAFFHGLTDIAFIV